MAEPTNLDDLTDEQWHVARIKLSACLCTPSFLAAWDGRCRCGHQWKQRKADFIGPGTWYPIAVNLGE